MTQPAGEKQNTPRKPRAGMRPCRECGVPYHPQRTMEDAGAFADPPFAYRDGNQEFCLACWLGLGPASATP